MTSKFPIKTIFNVEKGSLQSSKNTPGEYNFITASSEWKNHNTFSHDCEAIIVAVAASGSLGRTHYVHGKFISSDLCFILTPKKENKVNLKFFFHYFNFIRSKLVAELATGTSKLAINKENFENFEIVCPDYELQNKLLINMELVNSKHSEKATLFDSNFELIQNLRQSILSDAVSGKLVPQDPNDEPASELLERITAEKEKLTREKKVRKDKPLPSLSEKSFYSQLPLGWKSVRLNEIGFFCGGGTPSMQNSSYWGGNIPWISPKDFTGLELNNSELKITQLGIDNSSAKHIPSQSILIVARSGILKRKLPVAINTVDCSVNQDIKVIIPYLPEMSRYLQRLLLGQESKILKDFVKTGTTVQSLEYNLFENMVVPIPPLAEQKRIVAKVDQLMKLCDELENKVKENQKNSELLMEAVLKEAFDAK